jgi:hypothetical protein
MAISFKISINKLLSVVGYNAVLLFFCLVPFHFIVYNYCYSYKELFALLFALLTFFYLFINKYFRHLPKELGLLFIFIIFILVAAVVDPQKQLYDWEFKNISKSLNTFSPTLYVLRNALVYIPMVILISLRGLSRKEIERIAFIIAITAPISIAAFLLTFVFKNSIKLTELLALGGDGLQYNSYVPYLTFPFAASLFLFFSKTARFSKLFYILISLFIFLYIWVTASRQSFLFCALTTVFFANYCMKFKKASILFFITILGFVILVLINNPSSSLKTVERYSSLDGFLNSPRYEMMEDGLDRLTGMEYLTGAGLTSVINSGPHNDYIRWLQRIGLFGSLFAFLPFLYATSKSYCKLKETHDVLYVFITVGLFYTLYISLFGYPREDAYQAPFVWLGFALWLGIKKQKINI